MGLEIKGFYRWTFECDVCKKVVSGEGVQDDEVECVPFETIVVNVKGRVHRPHAKTIREMVVCVDCMAKPVTVVVEVAKALEERPITEILEAVA